MDGLSGLLKDYDSMKERISLLEKALIVNEYKHAMDSEWMRDTLAEINRKEGYKYNKLILNKKIYFNLAKEKNYTIISPEEISRRMMIY